jgi:hypothetical protein
MSDQGYGVFSAYMRDPMPGSKRPTEHEARIVLDRVKQATEEAYADLLRIEPEMREDLIDSLHVAPIARPAVEVTDE